MQCASAARGFACQQRYHIPDRDELVAADGQEQHFCRPDATITSLLLCTAVPGNAMQDVTLGRSASQAGYQPNAMTHDSRLCVPKFLNMDEDAGRPLLAHAQEDALWDRAEAATAGRAPKPAPTVGQLLAEHPSEVVRFLQTQGVVKLGEFDMQASGGSSWSRLALGARREGRSARCSLGRAAEARLAV